MVHYRAYSLMEINDIGDLYVDCQMSRDGFIDLPSDRLAAALSQAVDLGMVVEESPKSYPFSHHLLVETLLDRLPHGRRQELHGRVGAVLETRAMDRRRGKGF